MSCELLKIIGYSNINNELDVLVSALPSDFHDLVELNTKSVVGITVP